MIELNKLNKGSFCESVCDRYRSPDEPDSLLPILCVDDNIHLLKTYKSVLQRSGFEVVTACHGIDALMQYQAHQGQWGAIVTDHDMPKMCGLQFVRSVREAGFTGKILVASSFSGSKLREAYAPYAISGFLRKPFDLSTFKAMLLHER